MANVKDLKGNIIITDGKTIKDMKNEGLIFCLPEGVIIPAAR